MSALERVAIGPVLIEDDVVRPGRARLSIGSETRSLSAAELRELAATLDQAADIVSVTGYGR